MRKGLIATAVAVALFAVGAFAASFAVTSEDTASGSNAVDRCAEDVVVTFDEGYDPGTKNWNVDAVDLELTGPNLLVCGAQNAAVTVVLQDAGTTVVGTLTGTLTADDVTAGPPVTASLRLEPDATADDIPVRLVWNAAVLINGVQLNVSPATPTAP